MNLILDYPDTATFVTTRPSGFGNQKIVTQQVEVPVVFVQNTGFSRGNFREQIDSDAICYPDFKDDFIVENFNRLEGMYILEPLFGAGDDASWYKITSVTINRDHLLDNTIDNIALALKKTRPISGVS